MCSPISSPSVLFTIETMIAMKIMLKSTGAGRQRVLKDRNGQAKQELQIEAKLILRHAFVLSGQESLEKCIWLMTNDQFMGEIEGFMSPRILDRRKMV